MLKTFRTVSIFEGISLLLLLFVAMPAKYMLDYPALVPVVGMVHGLLWLTYLFTSLSTSHQQAWSVFYWLFVLLLSVVPFGFLVLERQLRTEVVNDTSAMVDEG